MDRYKLIIFLLLIIFLGYAEAQIQKYHRAVLSQNRGTVAPPACPGSYCENFETTGAPNAFWTGTGDFDNTSSPLAGAQDVKLDPGEQITYDPSFNAPTLYVVFRIKFNESLENSEGILDFRNTAGSGIAGMGILASSADWRCTGTSATTTSGGDPIADGAFTTGAIVKALYVISTANNGILRTWTWNGSIWQMVCEITTHQAVNNVDRFSFTNNASPETMQVDHVITSTTDILTPNF